MFSGHLYWPDFEYLLDKTGKPAQHLQFLTYCGKDKDSKLWKVTVKIISMEEGHLLD